MKANWNDEITLTLSEKGIRIYKAYYPSEVVPGLKGNKLKIKLWVAASVFGPHLSMGFNMPFEDSNFELHLPYGD
jgi:hypothetical protein